MKNKWIPISVLGLLAQSDSVMAGTNQTSTGTSNLLIGIIVILIVAAVGVIIYLRGHLNKHTEEMRGLINTMEGHLEEKDSLLEKARLHNLEMAQMVAIGRQVSDMMDDITAQFGMIQHILEHHYRAGTALRPAIEAGGESMHEVQEAVEHMASSHQSMRGTMALINRSIEAFRDVAYKSFDDIEEPVPVHQYIENVYLMMRHQLEKANLEITLDVPELTAVTQPGAMCQAILQLLMASVQVEGTGRIRIAAGFDRHRFFVVYRDDRRLLDEAQLSEIREKGWQLEGYDSPVLEHLLMSEYVVKEKLSGKFRIELRNGKGTEIDLLLPLIELDATDGKMDSEVG